MVSTPKRDFARLCSESGARGHSIHTQSHGVLVATNINDLIECIVCSKLTHLRQLDPIETLDYAPDVVVQHIMGNGDGGWSRGRTRPFDTIRSAYSFRNLERDTFDRILEYLEGGGRSLREKYRETFGKIEEARWAVAHRLEKGGAWNTSSTSAPFTPMGWWQFLLGRRPSWLGRGAFL